MIIFIGKKSKPDGFHKNHCNVHLLLVICFILISQNAISAFSVEQEQILYGDNLHEENNDFKEHINLFCFVKIDKCTTYVHTLPFSLLILHEFLDENNILPRISDFTIILINILADMGILSPIILPHMITYVEFNDKSTIVHTYGLFGYRPLKRQTNMYPQAILIGFSGFRQVNFTNGDISLMGWALCCYVK